MVLSWLGRLLSPGATPRRAPRRPRTRLELEALEPRWVPAAIRNLGGFTGNSLAGNDDGSTSAVNVGFNMNFFGTQANQVFVNNNGNVTFGQALSQFTPSALNSDNGGIPIIAPYFADVDTRQNSSVVTYGTDTLCGRSVFGVDWIHVNYFDSTAGGHVDKFDNFQLILIDRSDTGAGNFDIEFNYDTITWETGDASGGTNGLGGNSARVGFSNGSGTAGTFFELPGSGVNGAFLDGGPMALNTQQQLSDTPGRLHFLVRNGQVIQSPSQLMMMSMSSTTTTSSGNTSGTGDVTGDTRVFAPFRYVTDTTTGLQTGNLTLFNLGIPGLIVTSSSSGSSTSTSGGSSPNAIDACLGITSTSTGSSSSSSSSSSASSPSTSFTLTNPTFVGPITVVFNNLPTDVQILNASGVTTSGKPFITVQVPSLPASPPVLRVGLLISNPSLDAPTTFFVDPALSVQVIGGQFNPNTH